MRHYENQNITDVNMFCPNINKPTIARLSCLLVCVVILSGCKKNENTAVENGQTPPLNQAVETNEQVETPVAYTENTVFFTHVNISLDLGSEWQQITNGLISKAFCISQPTLKGIKKNAGALVQLFTTQTTSTIKSVLENLNSSITSRPEVAAKTLRTVNFNVANKISGIDVSFDYLTANTNFPGLYRTHIFVFPIASNRCALLHFVTLASQDNGEMEQMIKNSLRLD